ncbi:hypothetical protein [Marinobacter changyiensis]|uniref:hypothetical protein n=1 Tax=Marinobacter changyiensis TaxID=2604091 RepID=UPI001FEAB0F9|nr:hypothetical protein [Marinobacter changyiensis]
MAYLSRRARASSKTQSFLGALRALYERLGGHEFKPDAGHDQAVTDAAGAVVLPIPLAPNSNGLSLRFTQSD